MIRGGTTERQQDKRLSSYGGELAVKENGYGMSKAGPGEKLREAGGIRNDNKELFGLTKRLRVM